MAPFNPPIQPTNSPAYGGNSRAVDVPDTIKPQGVQQNQIMPKGQEVGDTSAQYEGQAAAYGSQADAQGFYGDLFAGIAGISDQLGKIGVNMVKQDIENTVYNVADRERKSYTEALETIKKGPGVANIMNANASADDAPELPGELEGLPDTLGSLTAARDSNKISNTYYYGRLLAEAKDLRARYPGFREEIDQQFAKVTGVNPANAYIQALVGDINKATASAGGEQKKLESYIMQRAGYANADIALKNVQAGTWKSTDVIRWAAPQEKLDIDLKNRAAIRNDNKGTLEERKVQAGSDLDFAASVTVSTQVDNMLGKVGITDKNGAMKFLTDVEGGAYSPEQFRSAGQQLDAARASMRIQMLSDAAKSGLVKTLGTEEVTKRVDAALVPMDTLIDRVYKKDVGGIYQAQQAIKNQTDTEMLNLMKDSVLGPWATMTKVQRELGGDAWVTEYNKAAMFGDDKIPEKMKSYANRMKLTFQTQPRMGQTGTPTVMADVYQEMKAKGMDNKAIAAEGINEITKIGDKNTPDAIKENLALSAFHPNNRKFLSLIEADGVDDRGRPVPGRNAAFLKMTTPEITAEMERLGKKNPQLWLNYQNWAKESFGNELFNRDINDLSRQAENKDIKISWDSTNKRFIPQKTGELAKRDATNVTNNPSDIVAGIQQFKEVERTLNRVNSGLGNLKNVAQRSGQDVDAFLFQTMVDTGLDIRNINGVAGKLANSIIVSRFDKAKQDANRNK